MRGDEGQKSHDAERHGGPENPWAKFSPARVGMVGNDSHDRIKDGIPEAHDNQQGSCSLRGDSKGVGVKHQLKHYNRLENEIRRGVTEGVANLFFYCEWSGIVLHGGWVCRVFGLSGRIDY